MIQDTKANTAPGINLNKGDRIIMQEIFILLAHMTNTGQRDLIRYLVSENKN